MARFQCRRNLKHDYTRDDLLRFYRAAFQPEKLLVAISGDYDDDFREVVMSSLAAMPTSFIDPALLISPDNANLQLRPGTDGIFVDPIPTGSVELAIVLPGIGIEDDSQVAMGLLHFAMGGNTIDARINTELRENRGLTYGGSSGMIRYPGTGFQVFNVAVEPRNVIPALRSLRDLISQTCEEGLTLQELEDIKGSSRNGTILSYEDARTIPGQLLSKMFHHYYTGKPFETPAESIASIDAITLDDINSLAKRYFDLSQMQVFAVGETDHDTIIKALY